VSSKPHHHGGPPGIPGPKPPTGILPFGNTKGFGVEYHSIKGDFTLDESAGFFITSSSYEVNEKFCAAFTLGTGGDIFLYTLGNLACISASLNDTDPHNYYSTKFIGIGTNPLPGAFSWDGAYDLDGYGVHAKSLADCYAYAASGAVPDVVAVTFNSDPLEIMNCVPKGLPTGYGINVIGVMDGSDGLQKTSNVEPIFSLI